MQELSFTKVEGIGNDFVVIDRRGQDPTQEIEQLRSLAPALCHRRRGVGADGILVVGPPTTVKGDASMVVINHDGSRPEMCGNGLRCVALFVTEGTGNDKPTIDTDAGAKPCEVDLAGSNVLVDMGPGIDLGLKTPKTGAGRSFHAVSMGNPHAINFVGPDEDPQALARALGPAVECDELFPHRTNVEFVRVDPNALTLWVWERGVGMTDACGTGACATACAAVWAKHRSPQAPLDVRLPGGVLQVTVPADRSQGVLMRGPARIVYRGMLPATALKNTPDVAP